VLLVVLGLRLRFRARPVQRVEEELGLGEEMQLAETEASSK
jgi:hypothetical protein